MVNIWDPICKNVYPANMYPACNIYRIQVVLLLEYMQYVSNVLDTSIPTLRFYIVSNEYESSVLYIYIQDTLRIYIVSNQYAFSVLYLQDTSSHTIEILYCIHPICIQRAVYIKDTSSPILKIYIVSNQYVSSVLYRQDTSIPTLRFYIVSNQYVSSVLYIQDIN